MKLFAFVAVLVAVGAAQVSFAAENPTGTWKWEVKANNQTREQTLNLKLEGDKLTGAMVGANSKETAIEDPKFADDEVSFTVTRERNGMKTISKYSGKVSGDSIKGKVDTDRDGKSGSRDWEAKRAAK